MAQKIKIWEVNGKNLKELTEESLEAEDMVHDWVNDNISIISDDLLVIGKKVGTDLGLEADLLCIDRDGDLVIIEFKRDKTAREVTSQALEYASWVKDLSYDRIAKLAKEYLKKDLKEAFYEKFNAELPENINAAHRMLIVAAKIDTRTERIIKYLSDYGVDINATTFQYFTDADKKKKYLARVFLLDPAEAEEKARQRGGSKKRPKSSEDELLKIAQEKGVYDLYKYLVEELKKCLPKPYIDSNRKVFRFDGKVFSSELDQ